MQRVFMMKEAELAWLPHPRFRDVRIASLVTGTSDTGPMDCALVEMLPSAEVGEHVHDRQDDMLYVLCGTAVMWIDGQGDVPLVPGSFLRIPKGTRHRPHSFRDGFRVFNFWAAMPPSPNP